MNNETHTPEPWEVLSIESRIITVSGSEASNRTVFHIRFPDGKGGWSELTGEDEANARRIVAVINACAGVPTADLENVLTIEHKQLTAFGQACAPRDELAEALRLAGKFFDKYGFPRAACDEVELIRAALAKLK